MSTLLRSRYIATLCALCLFLLFTATMHAQHIEAIKTKPIDGFYVGVFGSHFTTNNTSTDDKLNFCIWRTATSHESTVYMPTALEYIYQLELVDTNGLALPRTEVGKRIGFTYNKLEPSFANDTGYELAIEHTIMSGAGVGAQYLFFPHKSGDYNGEPPHSPDDLFQIKNAGNYTLRICFQFIVASDTNVYKTAHIVRFPPLDYPLVKSAPDLLPNVQTNSLGK